MKKLFTTLVALLLTSLIGFAADAEPITVRLKASSLPKNWGDVAIYYWGGENSGWPGDKLTAVDGWYTKTFKSTTTSISIIWNNNDEGKQTVDIADVKASTCYEITGGSGTKHTVQVVACPTEPAITDIKITGTKFVNEELTFSAMVDGFSSEPAVDYFIKEGEGEYELLDENKFTPTATGGYTVKAYAAYDSEEAEKEVSFAVREKPADITVKLLARSVSWESAAIYAKDSKTGDELLGAWPGTAVAVNDGWFAKTLSGVDSVTVVFNNGIVGANNRKTVEIPTGVEKSVCVKVTKTNSPHDVALIGCDYDSVDVAIKLPAAWDEPAIFEWAGKGVGTVAKMTKSNDNAGEGLSWWTGKVDISSDGFLFKNKANDEDWDLQSSDVAVPSDKTCYELGAEAEGMYAIKVIDCNEPVVNYFARNNWDGTDWTWKQLSKQSEGGLYELVKVVYGGTGISINTKEDDADAIWIPQDDFIGDGVQAKDTVSFTFNPADSIITMTLIASPTPAQDTWTIAGDEELMGSNWEATDTNNDMTINNDKVSYSLTIDEVALEAQDYEYKAVKDHSWQGAQVPTQGNEILSISEAGNYKVEFYLVPGVGMLFANATKLTPSAIDEVEANANSSVYKIVENGEIIIVTPQGKFNILGVKK